MTLKDKVNMISDPKGWKNPDTGDKFFKIANLLVKKGFLEDQAIAIIREVCETSRKEDACE